MALTWVREDTPVWDAAKQSIVGGAPEGALEIPKLALGELAPGEWFRIEEDGATLGYGWMDCTWGDAEITIAVDPKREGGRDRGVHRFQPRAGGRGARCELPLQRGSPNAPRQDAGDGLALEPGLQA